MLARSSAGRRGTMHASTGQRMLARSNAVDVEQKMPERGNTGQQTGRSPAKYRRSGIAGAPRPALHGLPDVSAETRRHPSTRSGTFPRKRGTRPSTRSGTFPRKRGNPSAWPRMPAGAPRSARGGFPDVSGETRVRACPRQRQRCLTSAVGYAGEGGRGGDGWPVLPAGPAQPAARSVSRSAVAPSGWPRPTAMPSR
jgi:hypothetical protein